MRGTLLNTATVTVGGLAGLALSSYVPANYEQVALTGLGLVVVGLGIKMFLETKNILIIAASVALGGIIGLALGLSAGLDAFAEWARHSLGGGGHFNEAIITTSILFCVGPMTLLGCMQDGIEGKIELLAIKSTLDGIAAFFFAATLGAGVLVTAIVLLVVQTLLTLLAKRLQNFAKDEELIAEASAAGGTMMMAIGLGLLEIKKIATPNYLPALVLAPLFVLIGRRMTLRKAAAI